MRAPGRAVLESIRFRFGERTLSLLRLAIAAVGLGFGLLATMSPHWQRLGLWLISLPLPRNPLAWSLFGCLLWYAAVARHRESSQFVHRALANFLTSWLAWDWRARLFFVISTCNLTVLLVHAGWYPRHLDQDGENREFAVVHAEGGLGIHKIASLEHFARQVVERTPADARILYQGRTAVVRLAYEVYPRRVFMLPQDFRTMATQWHVQPWMRDAPNDPHEAYWHQFLPVVNADQETFIREHAITYLARFDETDMSKCKLERVR
jgi:hypothetical protein